MSSKLFSRHRRPHLWSYHKLYGNPVDVDAVWADRETTERVGGWPTPRSWGEAIEKVEEKFKEQ